MALRFGIGAMDAADADAAPPDQDPTRAPHLGQGLEELTFRAARRFIERVAAKVSPIRR